MNAVDQAYLAGFRAAIDLAERAGTAILAAQWGHPVRREHAAAGLLHFADAAREAIGNNVADTVSATPEGVVLGAFIKGEPLDIGMATSALPGQAHLPKIGGVACADLRTRAASLGYVGEACPDCANFTLVRNGTCLKCDTCGSTTGCS